MTIIIIILLQVILHVTIFSVNRNWSILKLYYYEFVKVK